MKINIISCPSCYIFGNFGSALQAHALQMVLKQMGHDPLLVLSMDFPSHRFPSWAERCYSALRVYAPFVRRVTDAVRLGLNAIVGARSRRKLFASFVRRYLSVTSFGYTRQERIDCLPAADAYICGSDQILGACAADMSCFFPKVNRSQCIAYAASGSWPLLEQNEACIKRVGPYLREFRGVGVRESQGKEFCNKAGVQDVAVTIDPTMLLPAGHYERLMSPEPIIQEPYMLFYMLNMTSSADIPLEEAKRYCAEHHLRLIVLSGQGSQQLLSGELNDMTGPLEFLNLIKHASAVMTNSFHGSIFCVLFQTPYLVCLQSGKTAPENVRFHSAHGRLGQSARITAVGASDMSLLQVPPTSAAPLLEQWKSESYMFLRKHLDAIAAMNGCHTRK